MYSYFTESLYIIIKYIIYKFLVISYFALKLKKIETRLSIYNMLNLTVIY